MSVPNIDYFSKAIPISTGFAVNASTPIDARLILNNKNQLLSMPDIQKYVGMYVYLLDEDIQFQLKEDMSWDVNTVGYAFGNGAPTDTSIGQTVYIDKNNGDMYFKTITNKTTLECGWTFIMSLKGNKGDQGIQGPTGNRGSLWYTGDIMDSVESEPVTYPSSGISSARVGDLYFNDVSCNIYRCVTAGNADVSEWVYVSCVKGDKGDTGAQGEQGIQGLTGPQGDKGDTGIDGTYIISGTELEGDTDTTNGTIFPSASDKPVRINDLYLNILSGELYRSISAGALNEVYWVKSGRIIGNKIIPGEGDISEVNLSALVTYVNDNDWYVNILNGDVFRCTKSGPPKGSKWHKMMNLTGPQGIQGIQGVQGDSAYEVAVDNGFEGTEAEWLKSLHAETASASVTITPTQWTLTNGEYIATVNIAKEYNDLKDMVGITVKNMLTDGSNISYANIITFSATSTTLTAKIPKNIVSMYQKYNVTPVPKRNVIIQYQIIYF